MNRATEAAVTGEQVDVHVWDLPVRLFHWALAISVVVSWISGKAGRLDLHYASGLVVLGLVIFRLLWGVFGSPTARFAHFVKSPAAAMAYLRHAIASRHPSHSFGHNPAGGLMVVMLLAVIGLQAFTGLGNTDDVLFDGPLRDDLPDWMISLMSMAHEPISTLLLVLVALHIAVIIIYRFAKKENLVRAMLTGTASLPRDVAQAAATRGETRSAPLKRALICVLVAAVPPAAIHWLS